MVWIWIISIKATSIILFHCVRIQGKLFQRLENPKRLRQSQWNKQPKTGLHDISSEHRRFDYRWKKNTKFNNACNKHWKYGLNGVRSYDFNVEKKIHQFTAIIKNMRFLFACASNRNGESSNWCYKTKSGTDQESISMQICFLCLFYSLFFSVLGRKKNYWKKWNIGDDMNSFREEKKILQKEKKRRHKNTHWID